MRGKAPDLSLIRGILWITPAYAGKSEERYCQGCDVIGSPPPMRGKVLDLLEDLCAVGITPAYAGKSFLAYIWDGSS